MSALNLKELQEHLRKLIIAPEGPQKTQGLPATALPIRQRGNLSSEERAGIYANMYFYRIKESVEKDYPALLKLLGPDTFHNLMTDYLQAHPPVHFSLRNAGDRLPLFLESHALAKQYFFLPDLARFEWALIEAFDAADSPALEGTAFTGLPEEKWGDLKFQFVPSFQLQDFLWNVPEIFNALMEGQEVQPKNELLFLKIWRRDLVVYHAPADQSEKMALELLRAGQSFGEVCAVLDEMIPGDTAEHAAHLLSSWIQDQILSEIII